MDCIYFVQVVGRGPIKIGMTSEYGNLKQRLIVLQTACPYLLEILHVHENGPDNTELSERSLHALFKADKIHHEWFEPSENILNFIGDLKKGGDLSEYGFLNDRTHFLNNRYTGNKIKQGTQRRVAFEIGMSEGFMSKLISGKSRPSIQIAEKLASITNTQKELWFQQEGKNKRLAAIRNANMVSMAVRKRQWETDSLKPHRQGQINWEQSSIADVPSFFGGAEKGGERN